MSSVAPVSNYARVRRLANRYCFGVAIQIERLRESEIEVQKGPEEKSAEHADYTLKNDWEALLVFLIRLRRCLLMLNQIGPDLNLDQIFIERFDQEIPSLKKLRNFEEHFDDYSLGRGKNKDAEWGYLESYSYGATGFSNGVGELKTENARSAMLIAWEAVMSLEEDARALGYLTWEDRYGESEISGARP